MNLTSRNGKYLCVLAFLVVVAMTFSSRVRAQDEGWRIIRADFGHREQRADVTQLLIDLVA